MAINDVSLTSGMRSNLLSLQNTVNLLDRTQNRLSSGKKVNSAIDNPVSFFAAQALTSRASIIDGLKDAMGQAVQTIAAADKGITAITAMIEQAKGLAQSATTATNVQNTVDGVVTTTLTAGNTIIMGGVTLTATDGTASAAGGTFLAGTGITAAASAASLTEAINAATYVTNEFTAEADGATITLTKFTVATGREADAATGDVTGTGAAGITRTVNTAEESELESLQSQYNTLRTQLSELAEDSGYKGKNLLSDDTLTVKFEGTSLDVEGFDATATGLGVTAAAWTTTAATQIDADVDLLDAAAVTLRNESSKMSGNLSIITVRQDFSTNMINTLTQGSDKLTLADANEEGANMLMLQTRQSLSTSALSMSAQAAQSVLRLFQ